MNQQKKIVIEGLRGERATAIWELIKKAITEIFKEGDKIDFLEAEKEFYDYKHQINNSKNRWLLIEHYNIEEGLFCKTYEDKDNYLKNNELWELYEDYFSDSNGATEDLLIVDMKERKCYLYSKEIKYNSQEIKTE